MPAFWPHSRVWVLINGVGNTPIQKFLLSSLYSFDSIFLFWLCYSRIVWIDKLHSCAERIKLIVYERNRKKTLSHFSWEQLQRGKLASWKVWILQIRNITEKIEFTGWVTKSEKMLQPQELVLKKRLKS